MNQKGHNIPRTAVAVLNTSSSRHILKLSVQCNSFPLLRITLFCLLLSLLAGVKVDIINNTNTTLEISSSQYRRRLTYGDNQVFSYAASGQPVPFVVPYGVTSIYVEAIGAASGVGAGGTQGLGAKIASTLSVIPGTTLYIRIGGMGTNAYQSGGINGQNVGGFNGGGNAWYGAGGGGATDIRNGTGTINNRLLVASGGGGPYFECSLPNGGNGGSPNGVTGTSSTCFGNAAGGGGATQSTYGSTNICGTACDGILGRGGNSNGGGGGGGGGGYYGGAGGYGGGGGGGGSSYSIGSDTTYPIPLTNTGDGSLTIFYNPQPTPSPTVMPSILTSQPSGQPSSQPTRQPTSQPSNSPSRHSTSHPSETPSVHPSRQPLLCPSCQPSASPTSQPLTLPSVQPCGQPSIIPTIQPSILPSNQPISGTMYGVNRVFTFAASGQPFTFIVPYGVTSIYVEAIGAASGIGNGGSQGLGAKVTSILSVMPGTTLYIYIGGKGTHALYSGGINGTNAGGFNGGGNGWYGAGGGGATDIRNGTGTVNNRLLIAAGGGGLYFMCFPSNGGNGGSPNGVAGTPGSCDSAAAGGSGGTQSTGGTNSNVNCVGCTGTLGQGGSSNFYGGGGGGGYYGGAAGYNGAAGGGGSSYSSGSDTTFPAPISNAEDGSLTIFYNSPPTFAPTLSPTLVPTYRPSMPTSQPSRQPSRQPSNPPSHQPTSQPSRTPSVQPSRQPSICPSCQPSVRPTVLPSNQPLTLPSAQPSGQPSRNPTQQPSALPSKQPTTQPSGRPLTQPTSQPSMHPTDIPPSQPSQLPSSHPSCQPTSQPSTTPSKKPTKLPTQQPSGQPTNKPSQRPLTQPTSQPSTTPSTQPATKPSIEPSYQPSMQPVTLPSIQPSSQPIAQPSQHPSGHPSCQPVVCPSAIPSTQPSGRLSGRPSSKPNGSPTERPIYQSTRQPSIQPSLQPTRRPTSQPSSLPSNQPISNHSVQPSQVPSIQPSRQPTLVPSSQPSLQPSGMPSAEPSRLPSSQPSVDPRPSTNPSSFTSDAPCPTVQPSSIPSSFTTARPNKQPSSFPSVTPSVQPSTHPTRQPSSQPTLLPSPHSLEIMPTMTSEEPTFMPISVLHERGNGTDFKIVLPFMFTNPVHGNGKFDVLVPEMNAGRSLLVLGNRQNSHTSFVGYEQLEMSPAISYDHTGRSVSNAGDVNGDGYADLIIGVPYAALCHVLFGTAKGFVHMTKGFTVYGADPSDLTGWSVSAAGDVNNDTFADLIIGVPSAGVSQFGAVYVLYGKDIPHDIDLSHLSADDGFVVYGASEQDSLGISVSEAGDANGDGFDDIVIGALRMSEFFSGGVYILFGSGDKSVKVVFLKELPVSVGFFVEGLPWSWFGYSVDRAGDVNGDGVDDILIGSVPRKFSLGIPISYIIFGIRSGTFASGVEKLATSQGVKIVGGGAVVSGVGDVNDDGLDDFLLIGGVDFSKGGGILIRTSSNIPQLTLLPSFRPSILPSIMPSKAPSVNPTFTDSADICSECNALRT